MYPSLFEEVLLLFSNFIKQSSLLTSERLFRVLQYDHIHFLQRDPTQISHHSYFFSSLRSIGANLREQGPQRRKSLVSWLVELIDFFKEFLLFQKHSKLGSSYPIVQEITSVHHTS
jgi:hypothetical protein